MKVLTPEVMKERSLQLQRSRDFFYQRDFIEVDTPHLDTHAGLEPHIDSFGVPLEDGSRGYLITSPERSLKKALGAGVDKLFELAHCYRAGERGVWHSREFLMLEWYVQNCALSKMMDLTADFISTFLKRELSVTRISLEDWFLSQYGHGLSREDLVRSLKDRGVANTETMAYQEAFYRLFLPTEEKFNREELTILYDYPKECGSYSRVEGDFSRRFEVYLQGVELANAFEEEKSAERLRRLLEDEQRERRELNKEAPPMDEAFVTALDEILTPVSGIALGWDRLFAIYMKSNGLDGVSSYHSTPFEDKIS